MFVHEVRTKLRDKNKDTEKMRGEVAVALIDAAITMGYEPVYPYPIIRTAVVRLMKSDSFSLADYLQDEDWEDEQDMADTLFDSIVDESHNAWLFINGAVGPFFADELLNDSAR